MSSFGNDLLDDHRILQKELRAFKTSLDEKWADAHLPEDVSEAVRYIHTHLFEESLDATRVRAECGLANHNFSSFFKHSVGVGMRKYIEKHRIAVAKHLLRHESISILDIAWAIGYTYPETFARAFRRNVGCSASDYRSRISLKRTNGSSVRHETSASDSARSTPNDARSTPPKKD